MEEAWRDFFLVSGRVTDYLRYRNAVDVQESSNIFGGGRAAGWETILW